ncbi:hypothetical protein ADL15_28640 [Actinoplanes awajinensis subsp. mycoplanecinus]|uniref:Uncharacterized protein n=1 Tax=Actinoplanes awajinensis subsp. mycoplanecinus TaxID=135947 RepID=A0A117MPW3_9ACTN|nr:hypothetical protein ADL15_28640 [Actinoplanes awajinensis subsp. mycoplanecinus]
MPARLVATVSAPLGPGSADTPSVLHRPGRGLLVQRGDTELVTLDLQAPGAEVRFPAPWPRTFGAATVSPGQDAAVFAGVHAVRLVDAGGATRWELRHRCWSGDLDCDDDHADADGGSAAFSSDGSLVWAHVPGPLDGDPIADEDEWTELWVVLDARTGEVLGRAETNTTGSMSFHTTPPDPSRMGLSIGEGEEGSPVLWGRWDGQELTAQQVDDELILLDVHPDGGDLLTVDAGQWTLALRDARTGATRGELDAADAVPAHPLNTRGGRVYWDVDAAFLDAETIVAGTAESDAPHGPGRHWVVDARELTLRGEVGYPIAVVGPARPAGSGAWYTVTEDRTTVHLWQLTDV